MTTPEATTGSPRPRTTFTARLETRIPPELDRRLRTFAVLRRTSLARVLADLLDRHLPTDLELAGGVCSGPAMQSRTDATIAELAAAIDRGEVHLADLLDRGGETSYFARVLQDRLLEAGNDH